MDIRGKYGLERSVGMVTIHNNMIEMHTKDTSYLLYTGRGGLVETLYYGARIRAPYPRPLVSKVEAGFGNDILRGGRQPALWAGNAVPICR